MCCQILNCDISWDNVTFVNLKSLGQYSVECSSICDNYVGYEIYLFNGDIMRACHVWLLECNRRII